MRFSEPTSIEGGRFVLDKVSASSPCTGTPKADALALGLAHWTVFTLRLPHVFRERMKQQIG
jgi:hypothetical protein